MTTVPEPPYTAVIFRSLRTSTDDGYDQMSARMEQLSSEQSGYLGHWSVSDPEGWGVTVSYWTDDASAGRWKEHPEHLAAQARGAAAWYREYQVEVAQVHRRYGR